MNTCTAPPIVANWYLLESCCVDGLGLGQLWQSGSTPLLFKAQIVLNNYESNCLRDWLSQRWKAQSLQHTTIALQHDQRLMLNLPLEAPSIQTAVEQFRAWLSSTLKEREQAIQAR